MSDVAIRFDGLVLAASLMVATAFYLIVALFAGAASLMATGIRPRRRVVARTALLLGLVNLAAFVAAAAYIETSGQPTGPDRIDWLALPVLVLFVAGCIVLACRKPSSRPGA